MNAASVNAALVIATTAGVPGAAPLARLLTREPRVEETEIGGVPADRGDARARRAMARRPGAQRGDPPRQSPSRRPAPRLEPGARRVPHRAARAARAGRGRAADARTAEATILAAEATALRADVRAGRAALLGVSTGAGLALLAAADERLRERVSVVAGVAPFADLRLVLRACDDRCLRA